MTESNFKDGWAFCFNEWSLDTRIKNELGLLLIISSLSSKTGVCFANNQHLSELFSETEVSISRKIKKLESLGYIKIDYEKRGCQITRREIRLTRLLIHDKQNCQSTINQIVKDNNININNNNINNKQEKEIKEKEELDYGNVKEAFDLWLDYKKERHQSYKPIGLKTALKKLIKLSNNNSSTAMDIVENAISNNYTGFFALKTNNTRPTSIFCDENGIPY